mmetsp:Transcript_15668/g.39790  ORF Transcript_15668/g.39790 Transcript_15668/m.39790 type:complete len:686 (-) Transcript_15668:83-2140(-)
MADEGTPDQRQRRGSGVIKSSGGFKYGFIEHTLYQLLSIKVAGDSRRDKALKHSLVQKAAAVVASKVPCCMLNVSSKALQHVEHIGKSELANIMLRKNGDRYSHFEAAVAEVPFAVLNGGRADAEKSVSAVVEDVVRRIEGAGRASTDLEQAEKESAEVAAKLAVESPPELDRIGVDNHPSVTLPSTSGGIRAELFGGITFVRKGWNGVAAAEESVLRNVAEYLLKTDPHVVYADLLLAYGRAIEYVRGENSGEYRLQNDRKMQFVSPPPTQIVLKGQPAVIQLGEPTGHCVNMTMRSYMTFLSGVKLKQNEKRPRLSFKMTDYSSLPSVFSFWAGETNQEGCNMLSELLIIAAVLTALNGEALVPGHGLSLPCVRLPAGDVLHHASPPTPGMLSPSTPGASGGGEVGQGSTGQEGKRKRGRPSRSSISGGGGGAHIPTSMPLVPLAPSDVDEGIALSTSLQQGGLGLFAGHPSASISSSLAMKGSNGGGRYAGEGEGSSGRKRRREDGEHPDMFDVSRVERLLETVSKAMALREKCRKQEEMESFDLIIETLLKEAKHFKTPSAAAMAASAAASASTPASGSAAALAGDGEAQAEKTSLSDLHAGRDPAEVGSSGEGQLAERERGEEGEEEEGRDEAAFDGRNASLEEGEGEGEEEEEQGGQKRQEIKRGESDEARVVVAEMGE